MPEKSVSMIVPTYNRETEVLECLKSLLKVDYPDFQIIVVDNASQDNTVASIRMSFPEIEVIQLSQNFGAAAARNAGTRQARGEYLCYVDSDNRVDPSFLTGLVNLAETDGRIGIVGPKMYYFTAPGTIWYAGADISLVTSKTKYIGTGEVDRGQFDNVREVGHVPNVWLTKRRVVDDIGLMDESYGTYYEESDWAMRATQAGYKVMFCPFSVVYHNIPAPASSRGLRSSLGFDTPYRVFHVARNRSLFMKKFADKKAFILFLLTFNNVFLAGYCLTFLLHRRFDLIRRYFAGYLEGIGL